MCVLKKKKCIVLIVVLLTAVFYQVILNAQTTASIEDNDKPIVRIQMSPGDSITTSTRVTWSYSYEDNNGYEEKQVEWKNKHYYYDAGQQTVRVRCKNSKGIWSSWSNITFTVKQSSSKRKNRTTSDKNGTSTANHLEYTLTSLSKAKIGDSVEFGKIKDIPLKWKVMANMDNELWLNLDTDLSLYAIPGYTYGFNMYDKNKTLGEQSIRNSWGDSDIRRWLNGDFYNNYFTENEKELIQNVPMESMLGYQDETKEDGLYLPSLTLNEVGITSRHKMIYRELTNSKVFLPSVTEALNMINYQEKDNALMYYTRDAVPNTMDRVYAIHKGNVEEVYAGSILVIKPCVIVKKSK